MEPHSRRASLAFALVLLLPATILTASAFPPDPEDCISDPVQPPQGGRQCDPWVDAYGDDMFGPLNMQDNPVLLEGTPLYAVGAAPGAAAANGSEPLLAFGSRLVCFDSGNCDFGTINVTRSLFVNETVTIGHNLTVGNGTGGDDDAIFFDDGVSEGLIWLDGDDTFAFTNDLIVGFDPGAAGAGLLSHQPSTMWFGHVGGAFIHYDPTDNGFSFSHQIEGVIDSSELSDHVASGDHDTRYYTRTEADGAFAAAGHTHPDLGDVTGVAAGTGLLGGGASGDLQLSVDPSVVQTRVAGACAVGSSIRAIQTDGTVVCETDDTGLASPGPGYVAPTDLGVFQLLQSVKPGVALCYADVSGNGKMDGWEPLYLDVSSDVCGAAVEPADLRLTATGPFAAFTKVAAGAPDVGRLVVPFEADSERVLFADRDGNGVFNRGDTLYTPPTGATSAVVTAGAFRWTAWDAARPAGSLVAAGDPDVSAVLGSLSPLHLDNAFAFWDLDGAGTVTVHDVYYLDLTSGSPKMPMINDVRLTGL